MNETTTENGGQPLELPKDLDDGEQFDLLLLAVRDYATGHTQKTDLVKSCDELLAMRKDR